MQPIIEWAPPKVNLTLRVLGRRLDGYHELDSIAAFAVDVADRLTLTPGAILRTSTHGPFGRSIAGENLVSVALARLALAAPNLVLGAVDLEKNLPIAAGIGGGSADAAAVLRAIMRANGAKAADVNWMALAASLGADVPVCLRVQAQRMRGIGEHLTIIDTLPELAVVLVNPQVPVPANKTAQVFAKLAAGPLSPYAQPLDTPFAFKNRTALLEHMRHVGNDLLPPARTVVPAIAEVLAALKASPSCEQVHMSGGGPTCFGVFADMSQATTAASHLSLAYPAWWIRPSRLV